MSSRDIEGENLLYLPQAKIYIGSCAIGARTTDLQLDGPLPHVRFARADDDPGPAVFAGETSVDRIKRTFDELIDYLFRSQTFPRGALLLTGAGVVPPDSFTLAGGDRVRITISGIGTLENPVTVV